MAVKVFFSYVHEDKDMADRLLQHLAALRHGGHIDLWYDHELSAGSEWRSEIDKHLSEAHIILLLVSAGFIASDYCYGIEMQQALARHEQGEAYVVPILLRPVLWREAPFAKLQVLPKNAKAISKWKSRDEGFENVTEGVLEVVQQWYAHKLSYPIEEKKRLLIDLSRLIEAVKLQMQPEPRALATTNTLQQLSILMPEDVTLADLRTGWLVLAHPHEGDEPSVVQRRKTCAELAQFALQFTDKPGRHSEAVKTWQVWLNAFQDKDDPRQTAMANTFARELAELQEAVH